MNPAYTLIRKTTVLLLALALCSATQTLWAQDTAVEVPEPETSTNEPETPDRAAPENITPTPDSNDSPFDYEASEEISQDLSVSYPVDI
jgi:hypothetical protein